MSRKIIGRPWIMAWGVLGVAATFVEAIVRLGARAATELSGDVSTGQWAALVALTILMTYVEGYRALQRRFVPSVVKRAYEASQRARPLWAVIAPIYAVSLIGAPAKVVMRSALGVMMIVVCVLVVRALPAPWRGIVDAAVAAALAWGLLALLVCYALALGARGTSPVHAASTQEST